MRGKPLLQSQSTGLNWITPADAGKTRLVGVDIQLRRDHPRGCGENNRAFMYVVDDAGSPPRMRGKLTTAQGLKHVGRITPADAGKTITRLSDIIGAEDHPRGCGENTLFQTSACTVAGSPPRMRGKLPHCRRSGT